MFGILSGILILEGAGLALYGPQIFSLGGWFTSIMLLIFAFAGRWLVLKEENTSDDVDASISEASNH